MRRPFSGEYKLTQGFGENLSDYSQFGLKGHNGLDYALPMRTEVLAPHNGKVIEAILDPLGYGLYIKIENDKEGSVLAHLDELRVGVGDIVEEGQLIAYSGDSGNATGPHLHWGYYLLPRDRTNGYNGFIDQISLLDVMAVITQKELDIMRLRRDELYNLLRDANKKIEELTTKLQEEQATAQGLREALAKQTKADSELGAQLLQVSHERDLIQSNLNAVRDALQIEKDAEIMAILTAIDNLRKPNDEIIKKYEVQLSECFANLEKGKIKTLREWFLYGWNLLRR